MKSAATPALAPFDEDAAFRDLRTLVRGPRPPIALIGAGASVASGYPDWSGLLRNLQTAAVQAGDTVAWRKDVEDLNDALWMAEVLTRKLPEGGLSKLIRRDFGPKGVEEPHLTLARMPFPHLLTTNYDHCLELALEAEKRPFQMISWRDEAAVSEFLIGLGHPEATRRVVHLHGRAGEDDDDIILTESDYVGRYIVSDDARRKLMAVFMTHPVVFIGFSMNDPDLANLMREVTARLKTPRGCHYALMSYKSPGDREATRDRMEGKFGIRPVFFSRIAREADEAVDEFGNLVHLLDALAGFPPRRLQTFASKSAPRFDPDDPNKGRFGGLPERNGRCLTVRKTAGSEAVGVLELEFVVEAHPSAPPLGPVTFFLHPTFGRRVINITPRDGRAVLERGCYGAFTIGVRTDGDATELEYDLALDEQLPLWFRQR